MGCAAGPKATTSSPGRENVYAPKPVFPASVVRVAVLPIALKSETESLAAGRDAMAALLPLELQRVERFEFTLVSSEKLVQWTGKPVWAADEPLPRDFLRKISEELECEAVLFSRLTQYRAYPPLAVGWEFKLIRTSSAGVLWAADELLDAGEKAEADRALQYERQRTKRLFGVEKGDLILVSPARFGQYSLNSLFSTLPGR
jgi:hypothetical protein